MQNLRNERGIALLTALLLTLIALAMIMALLYTVGWQTQLSGAHKRYKTSLDASHGGVELYTKQIMDKVLFQNITGLSLTNSLPGVSLVPASGACMKAKLELAPANWAAACGADSNLFEPTNKPDIRLTMQGVQGGYHVYAKIVDTVPGNSDVSGLSLDAGAGVAGTSAAVAPQHLPALYRIEVQGQREINPTEKAKLSVLYAY